MTDLAIQIELVGGAITLLALHYFFGPFSNEGLLLLIFCWILILTNELQNSAFESALDRLHPEHHNLIGHSKDLASAAVVCSGIFGLVSLYFVLSGRI